MEHYLIVDYSSSSGHTPHKGSDLPPRKPAKYLVPTFPQGGTQFPLSSRGDTAPTFFTGGHSSPFPHGGTQLPLSSWRGHSSHSPHRGDTAPTLLTGEHSSHFPHGGTQLPLSSQGDTAPTFLGGGGGTEHSSYFPPERKHSSISRIRIVGS